ncbi:MAG: DUF3987 domain-containing protein, partial [Magnetococcales bacterium]|nr:DUF3987 domain-containing protein [Magnetococcales bacterium]
MNSTFNDNLFEFNRFDNTDFSNKNIFEEAELLSQIGTYIKKYLDIGWTVLKVPYKSKSPVSNAWQKIDPDWISNDASDINRNFKDGGANIGIRLDHPLVDIDLDCGEACLLAPHYLPETDCIFGRKSNRSSHWVYHVDEKLPMKRFNGAKPAQKRAPGVNTPSVQDTIVEYRAGNTVQTIFPGSYHATTGEKIDWEPGKDKAPPEVEAKNLFECVRTLAAASLILEYYPNKGHRNFYILNIIGGLMIGGYTKEQTRKLLEPVIIEAEINCVDGSCSDSSTVLKERISLIDRTMEKIENGDNVSGFPTLTKEDIVTDKFVIKLKDFLSLKYKNSGGKSGSTLPAEPENWEDPILVDSSPLVSLDPNCIPSPFRNWIKDVSWRMSSPLESAAVTAILAVGALAGTRFCVTPKAFDKSWADYPNLWGCVIGKPSDMKSPVTKEIFKATSDVEKKYTVEYNAALSKYEINQFKLKEVEKGLKKSQQDVLTMEDPNERISTQATIDRTLSKMDFKPPVEKRFSVQDATTQKLGELLQENHYGLLVKKDELIGWLKSLERKDQEMDRPFYLESWSVYKNYKFDRITRATKTIPFLAMTIFGTITPGGFKSYVKGALDGDRGADGLLQRFQLMVFPPYKPYKHIDVIPDIAAFLIAKNIFKGIASYHPRSDQFTGEHIPEAISFSPEAQIIFDQWYPSLKNRVETEIECEAFQSHLNKYGKLFSALALIFYLIDRFDSKRVINGIQLEHAEMAKHWCDVLESHARKIYGIENITNHKPLLALLERINNGDIPRK